MVISSPPPQYLKKRDITGDNIVKAKVYEALLQVCMPLTCCLLQSVESLEQLVNLHFMSLKLNTLGLRYAQFFIKVTVEECRFNIDMIHFPVKSASCCKEQSQGVKMGYRSKCLLIVETSSFGKSFSDMWALWQMKVPSVSHFVKNTRLFLMVVWLGGRPTNIYVPFSFRLWSSSTIACCHRWASGICIAYSYIAGSL